MKHKVILLALVLLAACNSDDSPEVMPVPEVPKEPAPLEVAIVF